MTKSRPVLIVQRHDFKRLSRLREKLTRDGADVVRDRRAIDHRSPD